MLGERPDTSDIQGRATRGQFDRLKANLLVANGQSEVAQLNERGREQGLNISNFSVVSATSDDSSVTMIGLLKGTVPNENFDLHFGVLVGYAQRCIPTAIVIAPTSAMSAEAFEKLVRSVSFE